MTFSNDPAPELNLDIEALRALLERCEVENRNPSDDEVIALVGVEGALALGANAPGHPIDAHALSFYSTVIFPMGFVSDEHQNNAIAMFTGRMSLHDYVETLDDEEAATFLAEYPARAERFARRRTAVTRPLN